MTERERWIVYPLLFLCLGVSLRDKVTHTTTAKLIDAELIRCQAIQVGEIEPGQNRRGILPGTVTSFNDKGQAVAQFGPKLQCQEILVNDVAGVHQVRIGSVTRPDSSGKGLLSSGVITIHGETGREIIGLRARHQRKWEVRRLPREDQPDKFAIEIAGVTEQGGLVQVFDSTRATSLMLAHIPRQAGVPGRPEIPNQLGLYVTGGGKTLPLVAVRKQAAPTNPTKPPGPASEGAAPSE